MRSAVDRRKSARRKRGIQDRQPHPAIAAQCLKVDLVAEGERAELLVGFLETRVGKAHVRRQATKDFRVRAGFAERGDRGFIDHEVGVAVARVHVEVLELCRRRQYVVGVVGGIGLKMFEHDCEQILAREAAQHFGGIWRDREWVAVVDDQAFDLGTEVLRWFAQQIIADRAHVDRAWVRLRAQLGPLERLMAHLGPA